MLVRPLRLLIYLLIVLGIVELYRQASTLVLQLTNIALIFMFAAVVAMLVTPIVDRIQGLPLLRGHRGAAVLVLYGAIVIVIGGAAALLAPTVITDASKLGQQVPAIEGAAQHLLDSAESTLRTFGINLTYKIPRGGASLGGDISPASLTTIGGLVSPVVNVLLVIVISIYLTSQGRELVATGRKLFPAQERIFDFTMLAVGAAVAAYVRAQLLMSLLMGLYTGVTLFASGRPLRRRPWRRRLLSRDVAPRRGADRFPAGDCRGRDAEPAAGDRSDCHQPLGTRYRGIHPRSADQRQGNADSPPRGNGCAFDRR